MNVARKTIGLWLPTRTSLSPISLATPGMWIEELKADFLAALRRTGDFDIVDGLDFRQAYINKGSVFLGDFNFADLDLFFWVGELDRGRGSFHIDLLEAIGEQTIVINDAASLRLALDKLLTQRALSRHGIAVPEYLAVSRTNVAQVEKLIEHKLFILKPRLGTFGIGITRVANFDHLVDILDYSEIDAHFLEECIDCAPEDFMGINIIGGQIVSCYGKERAKFRGWKVLDRDRKGGGMVPKTPLPEQAQLALEVSRAIPLDMLGVDIVRSTATRLSYVVDVNSFPGLYPTLNKCSGHDVAQLFVDLITRKLERRPCSARGEAAATRSMMATAKES
jgi:glutathione synthase/RimK-type ligase-like ATP-grasp enzyme